MGGAGKLYRSSSNRMIAGVLGGIAERYGWNPTLLRVIFVLASLVLSAGLLGVLIYLIGWMVIRERGA